MSEGLTTSDDLWNPYKELHKIVSRHLQNETDNHAELEGILRKYKQNFFTLLQNPPKNAKSREELKKGMVDGITVKGIGHQVLSKELYQEAIIISDMYDLNEFIALDLLCTAQIQMALYPGLARGLVAILLYYDGRKELVLTLRLLVQARKGILWCLNIKNDLEKFITTYTDHLMENGLFNRIFDLLRTLDISKEIEKLQQNVALGGPRHRRQVMDLFTDIRQILAEIIYLWAAQCGLSKQSTLSLINFLRQTKLEEDAAGKLDNVTMYLEMALLYALDLSILHTREDGEEVVQNLPISAEKDFIESVFAELSPSKPKWVCEGLQATATFAFSVTLASLRIAPQTHQSAAEQEDLFLSSAVEMKVFQFLKNVFLENDLLYQEEFLLKRIHNLITDFIVMLYSKVKELRIKADETSRTIHLYALQGVEPPANLPRHFEYFMLVIDKFYRKNFLNLQLMLDFWCPLEINPNQSYSYRVLPRSISLFKFLQLAGDMLPPTLFVPYLNMLSSLSSCQPAARHCFNMLRQTGLGSSNTITWDHFFMSLNQYYNNLRQEVPPIGDTVYRHPTMYHKGITPQEVLGLHAVLRLIRTVAEQDGFSRLALCEHPGWAPLSVILGLVGCSVPIPLKADLLLTLAAFSMSSEITVQMWNNLEASQILVTIPSTSSYQPRGIQTELDEIESRMEEYPLTLALLELLDVLTDSGIPPTLGAGPRQPGFDPYLTFIVNSVFLKFNTRLYKDPTEKWKVAASCLKLLQKFLDQYEPQLSDFPTNNKPNEFNSPPGFHIMLQLNSKSEFLNIVLYIIDEGEKLFKHYVPIAGQKYVEEATLCALNIIDRSLNLYSKFANLLTASSYSVLLTNLNKLLLNVNPRSGSPDHCLNIAKYVGYQLTLPNQSLAAVKILIDVTNSTLMHNQFMNILLSHEEENKIIRSGFVECLDLVLVTETAELTVAVKLKVLQLLKQCLSYTAPNFTHFLLGFELRDVSSTLFQLAGVLEFPRTCIHSLLYILNSAVESNACGNDVLQESAYHLLYLLCSSSKTADPVLRFLRSHHQNFFSNNLHYCYKNANEGASHLNQLSWLLKTTAIEIKLACCTGQIFYLKHLTYLLVGLPVPDVDNLNDAFSLVKKNSLGEEPVRKFHVTENMKINNLLIDLISKLDLNVEEVVSPRWEYFDNGILETLLNNCQTKTSPKLVDIKKLHQVLIDELSALQGNAAVGQRQAILQEIQKVLLHAVNINNSRNTAASIINFVDSWRQVAQVLAVYIPLNILSASEQQHLDIYLIENLLSTISNVQLLPDVANYLSGAILLLLENMRRCHIKEQKQKKIENYTTPSTVQVNCGSLKTILSSIISWIMASSVSAQKLRTNLYSSLVTFLHLINIQELNTNTQVESSFYVSRLDSSQLPVHDENKPLSISLDIFSTCGEALIDLICQDCIGGQDVCKMMAMSTFSLLIGITGNVHWITYISGRGYLKHMVQSILDSDKDLRSAIEPAPQNLRNLYLYESKIGLLTRIATTKVGAELLLEQRMLSYLSCMTVFSLHPEIMKQAQVSNESLMDYMLPVENRYLQILFPTLHMCNAILTSMGTENKSAAVQVMCYLLSHLDVVELVLRGGTPSLAVLFLEELALITSVIARTATTDLIGVLEKDQALQENCAHLYRVQKLMLSLLPKFLLTDTIKRDLLCSTDEENSAYQPCERLLFVLEIISNILLYSRNLIHNRTIDRTNIGVIFQPTLGETFNNFSNGQQNTNYERSPSLGVIVQHLINTVHSHEKEKVNSDLLHRKVREIPEMNTIDLKDFIGSQPQTFDIKLLREKALDVVSQKLNEKKKEIDYYTFIIDNSLYLIWAHLDYYMLRAIPKSSFTGLNPSTLASASEVTWKVSTDDISSLKQGLVSIFNDSFSRQLIETAQELSQSNRGFVEALLRKIKRLIQFVPVK